ncbi:hypothetical protein RB195_022838 [Necator americanus]|uniref:Uncharacterized protein n=1 Tax=Necator americanus TaxID=51031 RepID=A0ABR1EIZ9_NECAM
MLGTDDKRNDKRDVQKLTEVIFLMYHDISDLYSEESFIRFNEINSEPGPSTDWLAKKKKSVLYTAYRSTRIFRFEYAPRATDLRCETKTAKES